MDIKYQYFLRVAEKLNMSLVAKDCFISHQGVSFHIRKLEETLNSKLFNRHPTLSLTREGKILFDALKRMQFIEKGFLAQLSEENENPCGKIRIGFPLSRDNILIPMLLPEFKKIYPNVDVETISDLSYVLEIKTLHGDIDLFIGMGHVDVPNLNVIELMNESYYLMISDCLLKQYFPGSYPECIDKYAQGVYLKEFRHIPFILTAPPSRLRRALDMSAEKNDFTFNVIMQTNNVNVCTMLCQKQMGACITSQMFFPSLQYLNTNVSPGEYIYMFPIKDAFDYCSTIFVAFNREKYMTMYQKYFIELTQKLFSGQRMFQYKSG